MRHFLIYTNRHKDEQSVTTKRIREYLESRGCRVTLREAGDWKAEEFQETGAFKGTEEARQDAVRESGLQGSPAQGGIPGGWTSGDSGERDDLPEEVDCMIVLGGDGTVLQAARKTGKRHIPIIGINLGTMGYMTEVEPDNLEEALDRLLRGDYTGEVRMMLNGTVQFGSAKEDEEGWCLNDIVISRKGSIRIISLDIYVNGQFLHGYKADGVIVTTPTGSTGYSLSAGGPLIEPCAKLIMLTPICPHSLNQRSIVFAPEDVIEIEVAPGAGGHKQMVEVTFDGSHRVSMCTGDRIRIVQSERTTEFIRLNRVSFMEVLHRKFSE